MADLRRVLSGICALSSATLAGQFQTFLRGVRELWDALALVASRATGCVRSSTADRRRLLGGVSRIPWHAAERNEVVSRPHPVFDKARGALLVALIGLFALSIAFFGSTPALAQDQLDVPANVWAWFVNRDGSCVQCSIGMCGVWQNVPAASCLLWDTAYGSRVRGGSWPGRVEAYCDARRIAAYNVTGSNTWDWMRWAAKTGRMSAIGCFGSHFQTLLWHDPAPGAARPWVVQNNWSGTFGKPYRFTEAEFKRHHLASGQWVVILKTPSPPALPVYREWWRDSSTR